MNKTRRTGISPPGIILSILFLPVLIAVFGVAGTSEGRADAGAGSEPLWVSVSQAVVRIDPSSQETLAGIFLRNNPLALAVDEARQRVWVHTTRGLEAFNFAGEPVHQQTLSVPRGESAAMHVDSSDGMLWLVSHNRVLGLDPDGAVRFEQRLAEPSRGVAHDASRGWLWVGQRDTLIGFDREGMEVQRVDLSGIGHLQALAFDGRANRLIFVAGESIHEVQGFDQPRLLASDRRLRHIDQLAADGHGKLWLADDHNLLRVDADAQIDLHIRPLQQYSPEAIVALVADEVSGGVWVASRRELVHIDNEGMAATAFKPAMADNRTRNILGLLLQASADVPRLEVQAPADGTFLNTAELRFDLRVQGSDIDVESFALIVNGEAIESSCELHGEHAECSLEMTLLDGAYEVAVTVADVQGRRSRPAQVGFVIDTLRPAIVIDFPEDGHLTNAEALIIRGRIDEAAAISVNDTEVAQRDDLGFEHGPVTLEEGANPFVIVAVDRAGNRSEATVVALLDTIPPEPPAAQLITVDSIEQGLVRISGKPGSVEAGSSVSVMNTRTGNQVTVQAGDDGSFSLQLAAEEGDALQVTATDAAGNSSTGTELEVVADPGAEPIRLSFISPLEGASLSGDFALVTLHLEGPENTGVVVNEQLATLLPAANDTFNAYARVPLEEASVTLTATAVAADGRRETETIDVQRLEPARYEIDVTHLTGLAPLEVRFELRDIRGFGIRQIRLDAEGDGSAVQVTDDPDAVLTHTYDGAPGLREARFSIVDNAGTIHQEVVPIVILDADHLDNLLRSVWAGLNDALREGDLEAALSFMTESARGSYGVVFEALLPHMPEVLDTFSDIYQLDLFADMGAYLLMTVVDDNARVFVVQFLRGNDGVWRVESL